MRKTVVFLGAGASRAFGLPLTNDIFPRLVARLIGADANEPPLFGEDENARTRLRDTLRAFLPGLEGLVADPHARETWRSLLPPVTDVLSALDYALLEGVSPRAGLTAADIEGARTLLERGVFELLIRNTDGDALRMEGVPGSVHEEWQNTMNKRLLPSRTASAGDAVRERTVTWLRRLGSDDNRVTLISTNYDIEVEQGLYDQLGWDSVFSGVDFGTPVRDPAQGTVHPRPLGAHHGIYKLHGSLNFLRCIVCGNVYVNPVGAIAYLSFLIGHRRPKRGDRWLESLWRHGANQCHCGHRPLRHVIVAPSYVRDVRDPVLLEIWRSALEALREADEWIIVGYSLPPEDVAIRALLLRAYQGRDSTQPPAVSVVQKARQEPELTRYRLLFPRHVYFPAAGGGGLENFLAERGL